MAKAKRTTILPYNPSIRFQGNLVEKKQTAVKKQMLVNILNLMQIQLKKMS